MLINQIPENCRFGCWACTVAKQDSYMKELITDGYSWMQPLLDLQIWLTSTHDPTVKHKVREFRKDTRQNRLSINMHSEKSPIWAAYKFEFRKKLLRKLLLAQKQIREDGPLKEVVLIRQAELLRIMQLWRSEKLGKPETLP